jgi:hypothetical protein
MTCGIVVQTLGDLMANGMGLNAHCGSTVCARGRALDIGVLIERFGSDYVYIGERRIAASLRCSCGHKGGALRVSAQSPYTTKWRRSISG